MQGRVFTASLKPVWSVNEIEAFLNNTRGVASVYVINHDKDVDGLVAVEPHTHVYIEYDTPRKVSTVANLLQVSDNFVEIVSNKKSMLRYLTHKDQSDKHQYSDYEVYTNNDVSYFQAVLGSTMSDKEIAEYIASGRGIELLGVVSSTKLRTIQSFLHFDSSNQTLNEIRQMRGELKRLYDFVDKVEVVTNQFMANLNAGVKEMASAMFGIAEEIKNVRVQSIAHKK